MKPNLILFGALTLSLFVVKCSLAQVSDSILAKRYSDLSWSFKDRLPDSSFHYAMLALKLSQKTGNYQIEAYSLADISNYYKRKEEYTQADEFLRYSLLIRSRYLDSGDIASGFNLMGLLHKQQESYDSAKYYFEKGLSVVNSNEELVVVGKLRDGLAMTLLNLGEYERAQSMLAQSIEMAITLNDSSMMAKGWQNTGVLYERIGKSGDALDYFHKAGRVYKSKNNLSGQIDILINTGAIYLKQRNFENAISNLERAKELTLETGFTENLSSLYNNIGLSFYGLKQFEAALASYLTAQELATKHKKHKRWVETSLNIIRLNLELEQPNKVTQLYPLILERTQIEGWHNFLPILYEIQSEALGQLNRYEEAFRISQLAINVNDSINREIDLAQERAMDMERLSKEQELLKQELKIRDGSIAREKAEKRAYQLSAIVVAIVLIFIIVLLYFRRHNMILKLEGVEREKNLLLEKKTVEEQTSYRIGQNLHDNLSSKLAAVQMSLDNIIPQLGKLPKKIMDSLARIDSVLEESSNDVRGIAHNLMDRALENKSLELELQQFLLLIDNPDRLEIHFIPTEIPTNLNDELKIEVIAMVRAIVKNVMDHANATEMTVQVISEEKNLQISVEDNGIGFDLKEVKLLKGKGLESLNERVKRIRGECHIESSEEKGTSIVIRVPKNK